MFFFYFDGKKTKALSYYIDDPSSLIYDSKNASSAIKVLEKDSVRVKDNVYILTGVIWNSGDIPITTEDVRQKLILNLSSAKEILNFKIVTQTDSTIAKFTLIPITNKSIGLTWRYFDPGYACKFQIIYTGYENSNFGLTGKVLDIKEFNQIAYEKIVSMRSLSFAITVISGLLMIISIFMMRLSKPNRILFILSFVIYLIAMSALMYVIIYLRKIGNVPFHNF